MNIFLISRGFPSKSDPQWGCFEYDQAKALATKGHHVVILSVDVRWKSRWRRPGIRIIKETGIISYDLYSGPWVLLSVLNLRIYERMSSWLMLKLFDNVVRKEGIPDILYAHYLDCFEYTIGIKKKYKIPVVGLEHWSEMGKVHPSEQALRKAVKVYPQLDKLLVVSHALRDNVYKYVGVDSDVLSNVIGEEFQWLGHRFDTEKVKFVSTGNLLQCKRMDLIIRSLSRIENVIDRCSVTIVGDGDDRQMLQDLIVKLHLEEIVRLVGRKTRKEIVEILNNSDVYIMASESETFGVAAAEALACGMPVIATNCGGPRDFVTQDNGVMIPINDEHKLAEAIEYMIEHYKDYNKKAIAEDFHKRFSAKAIANQLTDIFETIIKNRA